MVLFKRPHISSGSGLYSVVMTSLSGIVYNITGCAALSMGDGNFRPPQNPNPLTSPKKFVASDYVGDPYGCAKFGANPSTGGFWANGWNIMKFFLYIYTLFSWTHLQVRRDDGFSRLMAQTTRIRARMCLLGVSLTLLPILGCNTPKTPIFGAWIGVFKPNGQNIECFMLSKLLHRFQRNFAQR